MFTVLGILLTACDFARMVLIRQNTIFSVIPAMEIIEQNLHLFCMTEAQKKS